MYSSAPGATAGGAAPARVQARAAPVAAGLGLVVFVLLSVVLAFSVLLVYVIINNDIIFLVSSSILFYYRYYYYYSYVYDCSLLCAPPPLSRPASAQGEPLV